ncbi:ROK family protein [Corynebacterium poyangense]|uniref:ROK family protein n=1 Tax=Corynebacterium poyangense TaxID=2684405 RepID=A0A7H0SP81_9CORY|nr:ROK family protein [Corynebacterium poyangense]MBZ8177928.1 ROK family protein [Corynebacterium poyangense]QNQ90356.1 ROK family protein [Corynebacterium poyangense]
MSNISFGIDVGGSGIKGAKVDLANGEFIGDRIKILTPQPATPDAVAETVAEVLRQAEWDGPVGITLPSVIRNHTARSAANIDPSWIGTDVTELFHRHLGDRKVSVLNDADAAGLAEAAYGTPEARSGSVIFLTFGTGIGSAFLMDGNLFPNSEIGHLEVAGKEAEHRASSAVKEREGLSWKKWAKQVSKVLQTYEKLFSPSLFIVGGGISRKHEKWVPLLSCDTPVIAAELKNRAGIVGAAMAAHEDIQP